MLLFFRAFRAACWFKLGITRVPVYPGVYLHQGIPALGYTGMPGKERYLTNLPIDWTYRSMLHLFLDID